ncbi:MAG: septal ring lytic transglycosylase RlpA family protein, partial [Actinomycetota bacterium]
SEAFARLLDGSGPSNGIPAGFAGTGVSFEGIASWYGPGFEGKPTASGDIFDPDLYTAASKELPLGTWLYVEHQGRGVVVLVNDRGPYIDGRILDLSRAAAEVIGITGLGWIRAEILIKH